MQTTHDTKQPTMKLDRPATWTALAPMSSASEERPKLPSLKDEIKSLKDGMYSVLRVAYLPAWDYYILEADKFKQNIYKKSRPEIFNTLTELLKSSSEMWFLVQGLNWTILTQNSDGHWVEYANANSTSWAWEGLIEVYLPLEKDTDVDWSGGLF